MLVTISSYLLGAFIPVVPGIIIFSTPSHSQNVLVCIVNYIHGHLVFMINWAFLEYKLLKSLELGLTKQGIFKLWKIGNYVCSRKIAFF